MLGQGRESGPEHGMVVQHAAIHAHERRTAANRRAGKHREVDSAGTNRLTVERGCVREGTSEGDEFGVRHVGWRVDGQTGARITSTERIVHPSLSS